MANTTDVRAWLRELGEEPPLKGKLPQAAHARYEAAHRPAGPQLVPPLETEDDGGQADYDDGVDDSDFITADEPAPPADLPVPAAESRAEEQQPRRVATARRARRSFSERVWGGQGSKPKRPKKVHKRVSLRGMAEDFFLDAAWTFQGLPPVEKIMYLQAPYAGQAVEDTVRGTRADRWLQPAARADQKVKQLEGLTAAGWVILIMVRGRRDEAGNYDPATKLMFSGLRHALLAMSRSVPDFSFERQREKAEELRSASGDIDAMIAYLFEMPEPTEEQLMEMARMQAQRAADASS